MELSNTLIKYLEACKIKSFSPYIKNLLQSHTSYPGLIALTDTLNYLELEYVALEVESNKLSELPFPILVNTTIQGKKGFKIIKSKKELLPQIDNTIEDSNIVLYIEPNSPIKNAKHLELYQSNKTTTNWLTATYVSIALLSTSVFLYEFNLITFLLSILSILGMFVCSQIIQFSVGNESTLSEKLCSSNETKGCNKVLKSEAGKADRLIGLGDIGLAYFIFSYSMLLFSTINNQATLALQVLLVTTCIGVLGSAVSIWYQWRILKSWCKLCLLVIGILISEAIILTPLLLQPSYLTLDGFTIQFAFYLVLSIIGPALLVFLFRQRNYTIMDLEKTNVWLLRFKNSPKRFLSILTEKRVVNATKWPEDIVLGNPDGPLQLLAVCNPYCNPCAIAHETMESLLPHHSDQVGITIRFAVNTLDETFEGTIAINQIITNYYNASSHEAKEAAVNLWYKSMDMNTYLGQTGTQKSTIFHKELLEKHKTWCKQFSIQFTPTIFLNGYEIPDEYTPQELAKIIPTLID